MSIKNLVKYSIIVFVVCAIFIVFIVNGVLSSINESNLAHKRLAEYKDIGVSLQSASDYLTNEARTYVQFGEQVHFDNYWKEVKETKTREGLISRLKELNTPEKFLTLLDRAAQESNALVLIEDKALKLAQKNDYREARKLMYSNDYDDAKLRITSFISKFREAVENNAYQALKTSEKKVAVSKFFALITIIVCCFVVFTSYFMISRKTIRIIEMKTKIQELAEIGGDLRQRLAYDSNDEIGDISKSFDLFVEKIERIVKTVDSSVLEVKERMNSFSDNVTIVNNMTEDITKTVESIAQNSVSIAEETNKGLDETTKLATVLEEKLELVSMINNKSSDVTSLITEGQSSVDELNKKADENAVISSEISDIIAQTNNATNKIQEASEMIKEISEQTNLLALNAAIEAARAGESGRGFAVVAEEIRKLAEHSSSFANEIQTVINVLVEITHKAVEKMEIAEKIVKEQMVEMQNTQDKFHGIDGANKDMVSLIQSMSALSVELIKEKDELESVMKYLISVTEKSAAETEEIAATSQQQASSIHEIESASNALVEYTDVIHENLGQFDY